MVSIATPSGKSLDQQRGWLTQKKDGKQCQDHPYLGPIPDTGCKQPDQQRADHKDPGPMVAGQGGLFVEELSGHGCDDTRNLLEKNMI